MIRHAPRRGAMRPHSHSPLTRHSSHSSALHCGARQFSLSPTDKSSSSLFQCLWSEPPHPLTHSLVALSMSVELFRISSFTKLSHGVNRTRILRRAKAFDFSKGFVE